MKESRLPKHLASKIDQILDILEEEDVETYQDQLVIIANVLMAMGIHGIGADTSKTLSHEDIVQLAVSDRKRHGETVANATLVQALLMLSWLENS